MLLLVALTGKLDAGSALVASSRLPQLKDLLLPVVIASTVVSELLGPIATRYALPQVGSANKSASAKRHAIRLKVAKPPCIAHELLQRLFLHAQKIGKYLPDRFWFSSARQILINVEHTFG